MNNYFLLNGKERFNKVVTRVGHLRKDVEAE